MKKLSLLAKNLNLYSIEKVKMLSDDAQKARFTL
jgi:hypothetical protein